VLHIYHTRKKNCDVTKKTNKEKSREFDSNEGEMTISILHYELSREESLTVHAKCKNRDRTQGTQSSKSPERLRTRDCNLPDEPTPADALPGDADDLLPHLRHLRARRGAA
jgi:hypothetical protein